MKMTPPVKVSVVIVSWNAKTYLEECLRSLNNKVYSGPMEIVVVDNASEDGSADMVRLRFPNVELVPCTENLGFSKANNIGMQRCTGEYIALVNSDVQVLEGCMNILVNYCLKHPDVGLVGPFIIGRDGKQQISCRAAPNLWDLFCRALALDVWFPRSRLFNGSFLGHCDQRRIVTVDVLSGCFWLVSRRAIEEVGFLDELFFIYGEDLDWCKRFRDAGWGVVFVPEAKAIHYGGASSGNEPVRFSVEMQKADLQYWNKHHSSLAADSYVLVAVLHHSLRIIGHWSIAVLVGKGKPERLTKVRESVACLRWLILRRTEVE